MNAIEYLTNQHLEIDSLFDQIESAARVTTKRRLRRKLLDLVAVHAAIEERIFCPAARDAGMEDLLPCALVDHLAVESLAAELADADDGSAEAARLMALLRDRKRQHAALEESELFPRASRLLGPAALETLGWELAEAAERMMEPGVGARERLTAPMAVA